MSHVCPGQERTPSVMRSSSRRLQFPSLWVSENAKQNHVCPVVGALLRPLDEPGKPWCNVLRDDLRKLAAHNPSELGHLGAPERNPVPWHAFMLNERGVFLRLVRGVTSRVSWPPWQFPGLSMRLTRPRWTVCPNALSALLTHRVRAHCHRTAAFLQVNGAARHAMLNVRPPAWLVTIQHTVRERALRNFAPCPSKSAFTGICSVCDTGC